MTEIVVEQFVAAPPSVVYRYLTQSDLWATWQGSEAFLDPQRGGLFSVTMPNGMNARGQFVELVPDSKVAFTWGWVDRPGIPPGSTLVTIELQPSDEGTLLTLTHFNLPDDEAPHHLEGWRDHLPKLAEQAGQ